MTALKRPRILFVAESPTGGAGLAALRLFREMKSQDLEVRFLVYREASEATVGWNDPLELGSRPSLQRKIQKLWGKTLESWSSFQRWNRSRNRDWFFRGIPDEFEITTIFLGRKKLQNHSWFQWADIIHIHWTAGFLAPDQLWKEKKWVISLHDAYPFTAVCHFPHDCRQYETGCKVCPQLAMTRNPQMVSEVFARKQTGYGTGAQVTLHAPSNWIRDLASRSSLAKAFPSVVLPNLVPTGFFRLLDQASCRDWLRLPSGVKIGLFVAGAVGNVRKGFGWFLELAKTMVAEPWVFVVVGSGSVSDLPANCIPLGRLADPRLMAAAYNAADLFISTALQDNLPSTIMEAQLCGTPVIGFSVGGQPEMIIPNKTGFLSPCVGLEGLLEGLDWYRSTPPSRKDVATSAAARWNQEIIAKQWSTFYQELV